MKDSEEMTDEHQERASLSINNNEIEMFVAAQKADMDAHPAKTHMFLRRFEGEYLNQTQLARFAIQWYKAAKAHKEAFPYLVASTKDDEVRFELVEILREEYGNGDRDKIHAKLLRRFLRSLGIQDTDVDCAETLPAVERFSNRIRAVWSSEEPVFAFGLHFALEYLAASLHSHFANGLVRYAIFTPNDIEYFCYHKVAEQNHSDWSEVGLRHYLCSPENTLPLKAGIDLGKTLLQFLWDHFYIHVFGEITEAS